MVNTSAELSSVLTFSRFAFPFALTSLTNGHGARIIIKLWQKKFATQFIRVYIRNHKQMIKKLKKLPNL